MIIEARERLAINRGGVAQTHTFPLRTLRQFADSTVLFSAQLAVGIHGGCSDPKLAAPGVDLVDHGARDPNSAVQPTDGGDCGSGRPAVSAFGIIRATGRSSRVNAEEKPDGVVAQQPDRAAAVPGTGVDGVAQPCRRHAGQRDFFRVPPHRTCRFVAWITRDRQECRSIRITPGLQPHELNWPLEGLR